MSEHGCVEQVSGPDVARILCICGFRSLYHAGRRDLDAARRDHYLEVEQRAEAFVPQLDEHHFALIRALGDDRTEDERARDEIADTAERIAEADTIELRWVGDGRAMIRFGYRRRATVQSTGAIWEPDGPPPTGAIWETDGPPPEIDPDQ